MSAAANSTQSHVLVTGANGFVGKPTCLHLMSAGMTVRAAIRDAAVLLPTGIERIIVGDLGSKTDWMEALLGADSVVHLAARVHLMCDSLDDSLASYRQVNTEGTLNLARQAAAAGVRRFVFVSSIKVNGEGRSQPYTECDQPAPQDAYALSKWEAEQGLWVVAAQTGMEIVILRPPLVYGPGVGANFLKLLTWVAREIPLPLTAMCNRRSLVYVGNLASAIEKCLSHPGAPSKTFMVSDGAAISTAELVVVLAKALGMRQFSLPLSAGLVRTIGSMLGRRKEVDRLLGSLVVDDSTLRRDLDWHPPYSMEEGLRLTAAWLRCTQ